ncbi:MAG TPA: nuclear transport factor 2 family protein [Pyrinomonadaceae bacterium]|nr:nuclear transport factor 2 family protein [Pyrinomonadaceae bacterium]
MKRLILLAALLLGLSACSTTPSSNNANTSNTPANTNANTSATPKAEATTPSDAITAREKEIWDKIKAKDNAAVGDMLTDDFIYIAPDGIFDKAGTLNGVKNFEPTEITFSDWKVLMLDKDTAVVTYTVKAKGMSNGKPIPDTPLRASSAWVNRGGKWLGIYHQECEAKAAPTPPPSTAKSPEAKASPGGMASMPACGNDDAAAREKMIWDDLKKKDYNGFAGYLADDSIEVEPDGVYDKAGSVKLASQIDFSKATLSDFKAMNLGTDIQLVTYTAKGNAPGWGPQGERHTTIWAKHNGNWQAEFHHGTWIEAGPAPAKK